MVTPRNARDRLRQTVGVRGRLLLGVWPVLLAARQSGVPDSGRDLGGASPQPPLSALRQPTHLRQERLPLRGAVGLRPGGARSGGGAGRVRAVRRARAELRARRPAGPGDRVGGGCELHLYPAPCPRDCDFWKFFRSLIFVAKLLSDAF